MAATFPGGVKPFTTKRNGPDGDVVDASHINDLQDEVVAIETELLKTAGSVIDHGSLSGLGDNDHPQYSKIDHTHTEYAGANHKHDETYSPIEHTHTGYSPTNHNHDTAYVGMAGNQTVGGEKTFSALPKVPTTTPTSNDQVASKAYVDSVAGGGSGGPYVDLTSDQSVGGVKTFTSIPLLPSSMPSLANQVTSKAYVDSVAGGGGGGISMQDVYPIGSVFMSMNSTNPSTALGFGTWSAILGKVLVGVNSAETEFNAAGKTGGSKTVTLTQSQMPNHRHEISCSASQIPIPTGINPTQYNLMQPQGTYYTEYSGSGTAHNNLPPYFAIYIWIRTA